MSVLREFLCRLAGLLWRRGYDDVHDEIREHLRLLEEQYRARGMAPAEATRAARIAFGNVTGAAEAYRDQRTIPAIESIARDARYAARLLRRSPGFTITAVLTLALGICLNTTLFTALNAVAFHPLPVRDGDRLVRIERWLASEGRGDIQYAFSPDEFRYLASHAAMLTDLIAASWLNRMDDGAGERPLTQFVSENYFAALGAVPAAGNSLNVSDAAVVLSYPFWQRRYDGDVRAVGRTIRLNGHVFTIAGIASPTFIGTANPPQIPDVWAPMSAAGRVNGARTPARWFQLLGHVRAGTTIRRAEAQVSALARPLADTFRTADPTTALTLERATYFGETNDPRFAAFVVMLMAVVGLILLIACANLANMLLARATGRQKEIGMRLALGASRARIVRQLLTESVVLSLAGGAFGLLGSIWAARLLWLLIAEPVRLFAHGDVAPLVTLAPNGPVFAYTLALSVLAAAAFGLFPALRVSRPDLAATLKDEGTLFGRGRRRSVMRSVFVGGQVAISTALLLAAGLLLRGLAASRHSDTGYDTTRVFNVMYPRSQDDVLSRQNEALLVNRLAQSPGLTVALADRLPMAGTWTPPMTADSPSGRVSARTLANRVSPEYFATMGVPLIRGRGFRPDDHQDSAAAIVSESAAGLFWPQQDPLGRTFTLDMNFRGTLRTFQVIGVARDVRTANLSRVDPSYVYLPLDPSGSDQVIVRAAMSPRDGASVIRAVAGSVDPALLPDLDVTSLEEGPVRLWRAMIGVLAGFSGTLAVLALALASAGVYGVVAFLAASRRHEIGVRMALGAARSDVLRLVIADSLRPVAIGGAIGVAGAAILSAVLRSSLSFPGTPDILFGVSAFDVATFGGATALLAVVALGASAGPLWRSTRVDPVIALRL